MRKNQSQSSKPINKTKMKFIFTFVSRISVLIYAFLFIVDSVIFNNFFTMYINKTIYYISYVLNNIPIYDYYTQYFNRAFQYENYEYYINQGLLTGSSINIQFFNYYRKFFFEFLPIYISIFFMFSSLYEINIWFDDYNNKLKFRSLKPIRNPKETIQKIIDGMGIKDKKSLEKRYSTIEKLKEGIANAHKTQEAMLINNIDKHIYDKDNYFLHKGKNTVFNRELYYPSIGKEISVDKLKEIYSYFLLFKIAKTYTNFPLKKFTTTLDIPEERKSLLTWISSKSTPRYRNAVNEKGKIEIYELYYKIHRINKYLGLKYEYMSKYLNIIEERIKLKKQTPKK